MKKLYKLGLAAILSLAATPALAASDVLISDLRTLSSPEFAGRLTGTPGSRLAQAYIKRRFQELGVKPFGASYAMPFVFVDTRYGMQTDYPNAVNLVGHIRGSANPERIMVVSAHYDHLGLQKGRAHLGADDNASGVAAMLAVAAHFKQHPPRNTIVFAAFDGEEQGLRGAEAFIKAPPFAVKNIALNLNFDMVGRSDKQEVYVAGARYNPSLKPLVAKATAGSTVKFKMGHDSGRAPDGDWTYSSDHAVFHKAGIAFLYFGVEDHADYHKPGDTFEKIDPKFYTEVVRVLVSAAAVLDQNLDTLK